MITLRPVNELIPIPALPRLEGFVAVAEGFGREFEPGGVVGVAVDVLKEAVETVFYVVVEVVFLWGAAMGRGSESLDFDLRVGG